MTSIFRVPRSVESARRISYASNQPVVGFEHENLSARLKSPQAFLRTTLLQVMPLNARQLDCSRRGSNSTSTALAAYSAYLMVVVDRQILPAGQPPFDGLAHSGIASFSHGNTSFGQSFLSISGHSKVSSILHRIHLLYRHQEVLSNNTTFTALVS